MTEEIERKFLVTNDEWRSSVKRSAQIEQGYLAIGDLCEVRVRAADAEAFLTIKDRRQGAARFELEKRIRDEDAARLLALCPHDPIRKVRHTVPVGPHDWEVDEFGASNAGLVLAEVELSAVEEAIELPPWAGTEVTDDNRYRNASLALHPYQSW